MNLFERAGLSFLHRFDPETAHGLSLQALRLGAVPLPGLITSPRLRTRIRARFPSAVHGRRRPAPQARKSLTS